jgi:predicted lipid-binding transport protein (Tim44 family)
LSLERPSRVITLDEDGLDDPAAPAGGYWWVRTARMLDVFDIYTIIFLALAVFIFLRLRSVLGQRTGRERPPFNPYAAREARPAAPGDKADKVVALPPRKTDSAVAKSAEDKPVEEKPAEDRWKGVVAQDSTAATAGLDAIVAADKTFDAPHFVAGARSAYEMIVTAYAQGDRRALKNLLAKDVYDGFDSVIREREQRGETAEARFVSIDAADIIGAEQRGPNAQVTMRFVSQLVSVTRDKAGNVVDGNAEKVSDVTDVWTFARDVTSRDPNWKLVATESGS